MDSKFWNKNKQTNRKMSFFSCRRGRENEEKKEDNEREKCEELTVSHIDLQFSVTVRYLSSDYGKRDEK